MQIGFAMLEVGSVNEKNTQNILLKNVADACIGGMFWWACGYGIAFGKSPSGYFGTNLSWCTVGDFSDGSGLSYAIWFFEYCFAATAATIISGAVAERCTITGYMCYTSVMSALIYPVVVQFVWGPQGYFSTYLKSPNPDDYLFGCGVIDFSGSGVVHNVGGLAALVGAICVGPRKSFIDGTTTTPIYGPIFQTLGVLMLWFGWYGFNAVSTLAIVTYTGGFGEVAAKIMVTTTLSAVSGALSTFFLGSAVDSYRDGKPRLRLEYINNGVLIGLVAITAGCSVVEPWAAVVIGVFAAPFFLGTSKLVKLCGIDDVVDAFAMHGMCGAYGIIVVGFFAAPHNIRKAYGIYEGAEYKCAGLWYDGDGSQLRAQAVLLLFNLCWVGSMTFAVFGSLRLAGLLRVQEAVEDEGMDASEHGVDHRKQHVLTGGGVAMVPLGDLKFSAGPRDRTSSADRFPKF
jgi:Amt family ammonium transporter